MLLAPRVPASGNVVWDLLCCCCEHAAVDDECEGDCVGMWLLCVGVGKAAEAVAGLSMAGSVARSWGSSLGMVRTRWPVKGGRVMGCRTDG